MKVLAVGGVGYCGGHLVDRLVEEGHDVVVYDNLSYEDRYLKPVPFVYGDCRDTKKCLATAEGSDVCVWLSGIVGDGAAQNNPVLAHEVNYESIKNFSEEYKGKLIFPSTCSVFGANNNLLNELSPVNPLSVYASTKLMAEQHLLTNRPESLIFRLGTLFGISDTYSRLRLDLVVNILTLKACREETLSVFGGAQFRPLLSVKDVAEATIKGIELNKSGLYCLAWANYTIKEIAEHVVFVTSSRSEIEYTDIPYADARNYKVDTAKAEGWFTPKFSLTDGIKDLEKVFRENRIKDTDNPVYSNGRWLK